MAISVVGVDLSKSVFQLSIAETRHQKLPPQPDAQAAIDEFVDGGLSSFELRDFDVLKQILVGAMPDFRQRIVGLSSRGFITDF